MLPLMSCACRYGHVHKLAMKEKEGVDSVPGCEGILFQVSSFGPCAASHLHEVSLLPLLLQQALRHPSKYITTVPGLCLLRLCVALLLSSNCRSTATC